MTSLEILRHFVEETQQRDHFNKTRIDRLFSKWRIRQDQRMAVRNEENFSAKVVRAENPVPKIEPLKAGHVCECGNTYGSAKGLEIHRSLKHGRC